jgi:uncharacterized membrane protein YGL010W
MRTIDKLLDEYAESHLNRLNKAIHWIYVPPIVWTVVALLWSIPFPLDIGSGCPCRSITSACPAGWAWD